MLIASCKPLPRGLCKGPGECVYIGVWLRWEDEYLFLRYSIHAYKVLYTYSLIQFKMHFSIPTLMTFGLAAISNTLAAPTDFFDVEITFIGGPASYNLTIPADGQVHPTSMSFHLLFLELPALPIFSSLKPHLYLPQPFILHTSI